MNRVIRMSVSHAKVSFDLSMRRGTGHASPRPPLSQEEIGRERMGGGCTLMGEKRVTTFARPRFMGMVAWSQRQPRPEVHSKSPAEYVSCQTLTRVKGWSRINLDHTLRPVSLRPRGNTYLTSIKLWIWVFPLRSPACNKYSVEHITAWSIDPTWYTRIKQCQINLSHSL